MSPVIRAQDHGPVRVLRMEHGKVNALDLELCLAISAALREARAAGARAIVLTGTGTSFSAGVDLWRVVRDGRDYLERFLPALSAALLELFTIPLPVVAAVNGHAIAGGCVLVQACDHRLLAAGSGRTGLPELLVGIAFPSLALEIVRAATPRAHLQELIYGGRTYPPDEALARGLADELVPANELDARALELATRCGALAAPAFGLAKRQLRAEALERIERGGAAQDREALAIWCSDEGLAAIRAYLAKLKPTAGGGR
jgi:enoyl-CoA hydratase